MDARHVAPLYFMDRKHPFQITGKPSILLTRLLRTDLCLTAEVEHLKYGIFRVGVFENYTHHLSSHVDISIILYKFLEGLTINRPDYQSICFRRPGHSMCLLSLFSATDILARPV